MSWQEANHRRQLSGFWKIAQTTIPLPAADALTKVENGNYANRVGTYEDKSSSLCMSGQANNGKKEKNVHFEMFHRRCHVHFPLIGRVTCAVVFSGKLKFTGRVLLWTQFTIRHGISL